MSPGDRRLEELGLNSSAPPGQLLYDGWLVRLAPGKAKRARSVNAVYPSTLPIEAKVAYCEALYERAGLPALFRITPFSEPPQLDPALAARGYARFDETAVEACGIDGARCERGATEALPLEAWVDAVAALRGSPAVHREAHLARLEGLPLPKRAVALRRAGAVVATGLAIVEDGWVGLFDIVTHESERRRGHGRAIVAALLAAGRELGARHAYLQVSVDNAAARPLYRAFGFAERYRYWYRGRPGATG